LPNKIRVLIADDHAIVRQGLSVFLGTQDDIEVIGEAADGEQAVERALRLSPDVVLLDLVMPKLDGIGVIRQLRQAALATKVIVLTSFADDEKVFSAVQAGAAGYLLKDVQPRELSEAIRRVSAGESLLHPSVAANLVRELQRREPRNAAAADLTKRERQVLAEIARGHSNKEIALALGIAEKTVKTHVGNIFQKLHLADRTQAALYAVREHIVEL
jgi:two-component system, NarL family, response regulator LiaR